MKYVLMILLFCATAASCVSANIPSLTTCEYVASEDEERLWRRSEAEQKVLNGSGLIYEDDELYDYLYQVARKLQPPEIWAQMPFEINVIESPHLNAFAFPNGVFYIHTGILARMDNEAQLAALLGHEMTHCTHRHALRTLRYVKDITLFLAGGQESTIESGGMGNLGRVLGTLGSRISRSGYSQELETEADLVGLGLMAKAGYDPSEALKLFEHLEKERDEENMREPFFFGTHPRLRKRMENCNNFLKKNFKRSETQPKKTEVFYEKTHKLILHNAWLDLKAGRFRSAQRGAEKYLRFKPDEARPYYLLGEIFRQRGGKNDNKKAKAYYGTAIALDPSYPDIHKAIGLVYYKEGKMRLAKRSFETCLSLSHQRQDEAYILGYLEQCNR